MRTRIPKAFTIFGHRVKVIRDPDLVNRAECHGIYHHSQKIIVLDEARSESRSHAMTTYYHEMIHCILEHIGRPDLSKNENFVNLMADALYQILETSEN